MARNKAYREAEKKIEEARQTDTTELDLSSKWDSKDNEKLTELPESLGQLTQLQSLKLSNNQLTTLPESLGQLMQLQSLNLSSNQLTTLPESLGQLTQLQSLNLYNNQLTTLTKSLGQLIQLQSLNLSSNQLTTLPESLGQLTQLQSLNLSSNQLTTLPESLGQLTQLRSLSLWNNLLVEMPNSLLQLVNLKSLILATNQFTVLPNWLSNFTQLEMLLLFENLLFDLPNSFEHLSQLRMLSIAGNQFSSIPNCVYQLKKLEQLYATNNFIDKLNDEIGSLENLEVLSLGGETIAIESGSEVVYDDVEPTSLGNKLQTLPNCIAQLKYLHTLNLDNNPLNIELAEAYEQGLDAVKAYLRAKAEALITLNEAKLILVGEGEVGKTCLLSALRDEPFVAGLSSTHGIEIKPIKLTVPDNQNEITLNGWDFGGQRVYRPTHQLFFSAPAVYLVVWKPREGPQQGFVKEWIKLVKHREPEAKILVVATHGGPQQRQPDIDRQELWDIFGKETVVDFFFVDSKPDKNGKRKGIEDLKQVIARVASQLPEVGRSVPKSFADVRSVLQARNVPYLPHDEVLELCRQHKMDDEIAKLFITISHRLGHLTHYQHDPTLRDIVILRPDWLATAISYIFDDEFTRNAHGLVHFSRLAQLWTDPARPPETRYPEKLHGIFVRLMERFDLSYRAAELSLRGEVDPQSLIAQLVPDNRPDELHGWVDYPADGNVEQMQICRIVDDRGQSANAEGLFYQLIVRLHRYSLGRQNYVNSVHWQRGLVLDDDYNGRALLEHKGNDVHITVRAPYPEYFLAKLTGEVKYLVESFWEGLSCDVMVPCNEPCGKKAPGTGLFSVENLIAFKRQGLTAFPCMVAGCHQIQDSNMLLRNAPSASRTISLSELQNELAPIKGKLDEIDINTKRKLSQIAQSYDNLLKVLTDEAKEGPRLFSFVPVNRSRFNPRQWTTAKFRLTLWCEHSRKPLPLLNGEKSTQGVLEIELTREWFKQAAPFLKALTGTLSLVLPVAAAGLKLATDQAIYKTVEDQLSFSKEVIDASLSSSEKVVDWMGSKDDASLEQGEAVRARGSALRELHSLLKAKDPSFGGLVRVLNKHNEFLWVHPQFEGEY